MIYLVCLTGLPSTIKMRQVLKILQDARKQNIHYWLRMSSMKSTNDVMKIYIETYNKINADKLVALLTDKTYVSYDNITYTIKAFIESTCPMDATENTHKISETQNESKNKGKESSAIKQKNLYNETLNYTQLPKFTEPIKILLNEMDALIKKSKRKQMGYVIKVIRMQLKVRLSELFAGWSLEQVSSMPAQTIVARYRRAYHNGRDENFIKQACRIVRLACWPNHETMKDGIYFEELDIKDREKESAMDPNNENWAEKNPTNDEDRWSLASGSDDGGDVDMDRIDYGAEDYEHL